MSMNSFHSRNRRPPRPREAARATDRRADGASRADALMVAQGLAVSRSQARRAIEDRRVFSEHGRVAKPGQMLADTEALWVEPDETERFVSRGGLKLAAALAHTGINVRGRVCLDIGQSTGGFTDCLLQAGAEKVVGVEVGHDQLHPVMKRPGCITLEGINARRLTAADLGEHLPAGGFDLIACDASFISLTLLMPQWPTLLHHDGDILTLVKPQFEVGREGLGRHGVVRDPALYGEVEQRIRGAARELGLTVCDWFDSPIAGGGVGNTPGNREFLAWMRRASCSEQP